MNIIGIALLTSIAATAPMTLEQAIEIAHKNARDVVRARADVLIVDAQRARAVGAVLPSVDLFVRGRGTLQHEPIVETPRYRLLEPDGMPDAPSQYESDGFLDQNVIDDLFVARFTATLSVRQLVYDGGRWWTEIARFDDIQRVREAALREVAANVRLNVVRTFYGLERALRGLERFERREELGKQQLESAQALERSGSGGDVAVARRNLAEDRLALARARFLASRSRRSFNLAIARPADTPVQIRMPPHVSTSSVTIPSLDLPDLMEAKAAARSHRGAVEVQRANVEQTAKLVDIREAALLPSVTVGGNFRRFSRRPDRVFLDLPIANFYMGFDVTMRWNLYRGGADRARIEEAELNLQKAIADEENVLRSVLSEVEDSLENLALQLQIYELAVSSVAPASEAVVAQRKRYAAGETTILSLRDAELKYTQAQLGAINARLAVEIARESLRRAAGIDLVTDRSGP